MPDAASPIPPPATPRPERLVEQHATPPVPPAPLPPTPSPRPRTDRVNPSDSTLDLRR
jgi:hypothetical protein